MEYNTTLDEIRSKRPCIDGWGKLLASLGKTAADNEPLPLLSVLDSNGLGDALWVLSFVMQPEHDRLSRHFQAWCAKQVLYLFETKHPTDNRVRDQIKMLRNDSATQEKRDAARAAARDAAWDAAWDAARAAARDAARAAAWDAARDAAWAAAQDAARDAAWDAARAAARDAAWDAACDAARDAAWDAQEKQFRKMLTEPF